MKKKSKWTKAFRREYDRAYGIKYRKEHPEKGATKEYLREWYKKNAEHARQEQIDYRKKHLEKVKKQERECARKEYYDPKRRKNFDAAYMKWEQSLKGGYSNLKNDVKSRQLSLKLTFAEYCKIQTCICYYCERDFSQSSG